MQAGFDVQRVIAAHQAGMQVKAQRDRQAREAEDRKLQIEEQTSWPRFRTRLPRQSIESTA